MAFLLVIAPLHSFGGIGRIHDNGNLGVIDLAVDIGWKSTEAEFEYIKKEFAKASELLWDASEGQIRLGTITFHQMAANPFVADIFVKPGDGRPHSTGVGTIGSQAHLIRTYYDTFHQQPDWMMGLIIAHELGHYALGLYDEYRPNDGVPDCNTQGSCFAGDGDQGVPMDHENNCIMEPSTYRVNDEYFGSSEFCVASNHDLDLTCGPDIWGFMAGRETQQTKRSGHSCFETLASNFAFIQLPHNLPTAEPPPNFVAPSFIDQRNFAEAIMLVLDRSGSMTLSTENDYSEVCNNGLDDDLDKLVDEPDCTGSRMEYLMAASRLFLDLAFHSEEEVRVGIVSYSDNASLDHPITTLDARSLPILKARINGLSATGLTNTGDALSLAHAELVNQKDALRSALLFTDGYWNRGPDPVQVASSMAADEILVHAIGTGPAVHSEFLSEVSGESYGYPYYEADGAALPSAFANSWARMFGRTAIIPKIPFHTNTVVNAPEIPKTHEIPGDAWFTGETGLDTIPQGAVVNEIEFLVPSESRSLVAILSGAMPDMGNFDVDGELVSPSGDVCQIGAGQQPCVIVTDPHYRILILEEPEEGAWKLRIWSGKLGLEQRGFATVLYKGPEPALRVDMKEKAVSIHDSAVVEITPMFGSSLRDIDRFELMVRDPAGGLQSFPIHEAPKGGYFAEIQGLQYRGLHQVAVLARSGPSTYRSLGESWVGLPPGSTQVPLFEVGASITFGTLDGIVAWDTIGDGGR